MIWQRDPLQLDLLEQLSENESVAVLTASSIPGSSLIAWGPRCGMEAIDDDIRAGSA
jgi:hypothetical protein